MREILPSAAFWYLINVVFTLSGKLPEEDVSIADWVQRAFLTP